MESLYSWPNQKEGAGKFKYNFYKTSFKAIQILKGELSSRRLSKIHSKHKRIIQTERLEFPQKSRWIIGLEYGDIVDSNMDGLSTTCNSNAIKYDSNFLSDLQKEIKRKRK